MSSFACNWPWLFGGLIGGWLLWQLFDKLFRRDGEAAGLRVRRDLELANSRVGSLQGELATSREQLGLVRTDLDTMGETVRTRDGDVARLDAELAEWKTKYGTLETEHGEWKARHAALETEHGEWKKRHAALETEHGEWKDRHASLEVSSRDQLSRLETAGAAAAATAAAALAAATAKYSALTGELDEAKAAIAGHVTTHASLTAELERCRAASASVQQDLEAARATIAGHVSTHATLSGDLDASRASVATLQADAEAARAAHAALQGDLDTSRASFATLQADADAARAAHVALQGDLDASRASFATMQAELDAARVTIGGHETRHTRLVGDLDGSRAALAALQREFDALQVTVSGHASRADALDAELGRHRDIVAGLRRELEECGARRAQLEEDITRTAASAESARAFASAAEFGFTPRRSGRDDLLIIEGIGPKINELLIAGGIDTFAKLAAAPVTQVQGILDAAGPNFRLANPASWARQSAMCEAGDWSALRAYQDTLRAGVDAAKASRMTEEQRLAAAAEFGFVPRRFGRDDLTIVEGIGPKINELLVAGGIDTFAKLATAPVSAVQAILDKGGPNFRLANPATWAEQSRLCEENKWSALRTLQDALRAGVDTKRGDA